MTTTVRYFAPLVWQGPDSSILVRQAAPVVWTVQNANAYFRQAQAVQWFKTPTPVNLRKVTALQWSVDAPIVSMRKLTALQWTQDQLTFLMRTAKAVTWTQMATLGQLRQVQGTTLQVSSTQGQLRQIQGTTLQLTAVARPTGGIAGLWQLIQSDAKITVNSSLLSVSAVSVDSSVPNCNSSVMVAPIGTLLQQYSGTTKLSYNRVSLARAFVNSGTQWKLGTIASATTILALLSQINTVYGIALDPSDVVDGPVAAGVTKLTLTAATGSYVFTPGSNLLLQNTVALPTAVATVNLPGFTSARGNLIDPSLSTVITTMDLPGFDDASGSGPTSSTSTVLLLHADGTNGQTTTTDVAGHSVVLSGGSKLTTAFAKFGTSSLDNRTSGAACTIPDAPELRFPAGQDFTIEFFSYLTSTTGDTCFMVKGSRSFIELYNGSLQMGLDGSTPGSNLFNGIAGLTTGKWQHVAFTRQGTTWYVFIDGTLKSSAVSSGNFGATTAALTIGGGGAGTTNNLPGYLDEFRISRRCKWTASFTPPTTASGLEYAITPIASAFGSATPVYSTVPSAATTIYNYLPTINATFGTNFTTNDLVDGPIAAGATSITLKGSTTSYVYRRDSTVTLKQNSTLSLLHFNGTVGATTTTDETGRPVIMGPSAVLSATNKFGGSSYSGAASAANNYAMLGGVSGNDDYNLPADFTIEGWFNPSATDGVGTGTGESILFSKGIGSYVDYSQGGFYVSLGSTNNAIVKGLAANMTAGKWYHIALTRQGTTCNLWVNGVSVATFTSALAFGTTGYPFNFGAYWSSGIAWKGLIDECRIVKGTSLYNSTFTPPQAAFSLLFQLPTVASVFSTTVLQVTKPLADTTVRGLLGSIMIAAGVNMVPEDVVDGVVSAGSSTVTLTIAPGSANFAAGSQVTVTLAKKATALLMHFDGAVGSNAMIDEVGHVATVVGNASLGHATGAYGALTSNALFGAGGGSVQVSDAPDLRLTGDWTIDFVYSPTTVANPQQFLLSKTTATDGSGARIIMANGALGVVDDAGATLILASGAVTVSKQHVAVVKKGTTCTAYVNGVVVGTATSTTGFGNNAGTLVIGNFIGGTAPLVGWIDELRISNVARWTAPFTPPTAAYTVD